MLVSTPTKPYMHRSTTCDSSMAVSPTYHRRNCTPPRTTASYDSPMLPPSPLRQRPLFPIDTNAADAIEDSQQSPCKSPALAHNFNPFFAPKPQPITADDKEGSIFLSSASAMNAPFFSTSTSQPLLTPVKQLHRVSSRSALAGKTSTAAFATAAVLPAENLAPSARVGVGTKRKSTPLATPLRPNNVTPLKTTQSKRPDSSVSFECLAPLPAPRFTDRTPQTKAETEAYLKSQTASLTRLRLSDQKASVTEDSEFDGTASDSGCEMDEDEPDQSLFLSKTKPNSKGPQQHPRSLVFHPTVSKGKDKEEVAEAVSPGGHVTKRRARSRPLSAELREQAFKVPKSPIRQTSIMSRGGVNRPRHSGPVTFPSSLNRGLASPVSSSEGGSPRPRRRMATAHASAPRLNTDHHATNPARAPLSRIDSAALFFGPAIPAPTAQTTRARTTSSSNLSSSTQGARQTELRPNRHSYAGPQSSANDDEDYDREFMWNTFQARGLSPSPGSSPSYPALSHGHSRNSSADMDDEELFFGDDGGISPFILNVTKDSPSPAKPPLPMKYKSESVQRDRDASLISDEDDRASTGSSVGGGDSLAVIPKASTSLSSICSDEALVTPGVTPDGASGWPNTRVFVQEADDGHLHNTHPYGNEREDVDAFIMKTLAAASKGSAMPKKAPGTPVKKARMNYFGNARPWQSAVASKVGLKDDCDFKNGKAPRKSMPAAFPVAGGINHREGRDNFGDTDTEEEEYSPSMRRGKDEYSGLGLGMPPPPSGLKNNGSVLQRNHWLMRRSSSGAFSSGSDSTSLSSTPTRTKGIAVDWHLPKPRIPLRLSPSGDGDPLNKTFSPRSASGSSSSSLTPSSPTHSRRTSLVAGAPRRPSVTSRSLSDPFGLVGPAEDEQPGRFERDFEEIEEVGSGEFGKVIKVRSKTGDDNLYAIKKSKRFEGVKHRLRLREEVDILKHLSEAALTQFSDGHHPNVLAYIDSWEEDEALFICTELCESGNLARFLWEYGRVFPRLDEARVWKVIVDLSNGLSFIHNSGVIHLDLKPSNVFVTKEGRFKIGDFGMASLWPRPRHTSASPSDGQPGSVTSSSAVTTTTPTGGFEREGDKLYLAPEVLQGRYGKAADVFSFGMTILETASNIVVPDQLSVSSLDPGVAGRWAPSPHPAHRGEGWHRLRREDFSQVDLDEDSPELIELIYNMMRSDPAKRLTVDEVRAHPVVRRAREEMERREEALRSAGKSVWGASPLASVPDGFLEKILGREEDEMDTGA